MFNFEVCAYLLKIKEGDPAESGINHRNPAMARFRGLKFAPDIPPLAGGERGAF